MKNNRLFIFTDGFPYGKGEKTFIPPELEYLLRFYEVRIVSTARPAAMKNSTDTSPLPPGVECIWCGKRRPLHVVLSCLKMPFTQVGRSELARIFKCDTSVPLKLLQAMTSVLYYGLSDNLLQQFHRAGVFEGTERSLYYSFWFGRCAMALSLEKLHVPSLRFISRIHGYELYNARAPFGHQPFQWLKLNEADAIVFAAAEAQEYFEGTFGTQEDCHARFVLSRIGVSRPLDIRESLTETVTNNERKLIVSCSNVIPLKRVEMIAQALARLKHRDVRWVHFGSGSELNRIQAMSTELGLDAEFLGAVPNECIQRFYAKNNVDLFITTSSTEGGCPVSITEALSFGIPIIGTHVGGIPEQIDGNGILLEANPSVDQIVKAIDTILGLSPNEKEAARMRSLEIFKDRFTLEDNLLIIKNLIEDEFAALEKDLR